MSLLVILKKTVLAVKFRKKQNKQNKTNKYKGMRASRIARGQWVISVACNIRVMFYTAHRK